MDQNQIDFVNSQAQWEATHAALMQARATAEQNMQALRKGGMNAQGTQLPQMYDAAQKTLAAIDAKLEQHAATKPGAAGRGDPTATARQANIAGVGSDMYVPDPQAIRIAQNQKSRGSEIGMGDEFLAFLKRATPFLGQQGDFYNATSPGVMPFDDPTLQAILDPAGFNERTFGAAQLGVGAMAPATGDVTLGLNAGQIAAPSVDAQRNKESTGIKAGNTALNRLQRLEGIAGGIEAIGRKGIKGVGYGAGALATGAGASAGAAKFIGPEYDFLGQLAHMATDNPTLRRVLSTDTFQTHLQNKETEAQQQKLREAFDSRLFKGLYGYDRKAMGGYNDVDPFETLRSSRDRFVTNSVNKSTAKSGNAPGLTESTRTSLVASSKDLDKLMAAAATEGRVGPISKNTKKLIRENAAFKAMIEANPKDVFYSGSVDREGSDVPSIYGIGLSEDGTDLTFGRGTGKRADMFEQFNFEAD